MFTPYIAIATDFAGSTFAEELFTASWNVYTCEVCTDYVGQDSNYMEELMDFFGLTFKNVYEEDDIKDNLQVFQKWYMAAKWYEVYDFIEAYLAFLPMTLEGMR